jgi:tetratricopeptide (TPR) repeat protein
MSYQEEERSRLRRQATRQAIALAMQGRWREAIAVNQSILDLFPHDVEALNRLGRAYLELGDYDRAEQAYRRTAEVDPYNAIATKNLQRLSRLRETAVAVQSRADRLDPQAFIEEVGKAGVVHVVELAPPETIAKTAAGDRVELRPESAGLVVESTQGEYLGRVEDRDGQRLARLMEGGNRYSAAIVSAAEGNVSVIVREVYQHPNQVGRPSFPARGAAEERPEVADRVARREITQDIAPEDAGYTVVGEGEEPELLVEDTSDDYEDNGEEE